MDNLAQARPMRPDRSRTTVPAQSCLNSAEWLTGICGAAGQPPPRSNPPHYSQCRRRSDGQGLGVRRQPVFWRIASAVTPGRRQSRADDPP